MPANPSKPKTLKAPKTPKAPAKPTVLRAVKELRTRLGLTQQQFATQLGMAISTVVRYELSRPPRLEALRRLYDLAVENGFDDVAEMFREAKLEELRGVLRNAEATNRAAQGTHRSYLEMQHHTITAALDAILRNAKTVPDVQKPLGDALGAIRAGYAVLTKAQAQAGGAEEIGSDELKTAIDRLNATMKGKQS